MTKAECTMNKGDIISKLKEGLVAEYRAVENYQDLLKNMQNAANRDQIGMILADERKHIKIVENLIQMVNKYVD